MGIKRIVDTSFWTDGKVDEFTPEDKYFMLYLLTNPFSTQLGIYEISIKQVAFQLGYATDAVKSLIDRFENKYGMIVFSKETNEIAIKNFLRHSIIKGGKPVEDCIKKEMLKVKNKALITTVFRHISGKDDLNETVKKIVNEYDVENHNENDNENDNENEESYPDSSYESYPDSSSLQPCMYGKYKNVFLEDEDLTALKTDLPDVWSEYIERLSSYMARSGKTYANHRATIEAWAKEDAQKKQQQGQAANVPQTACRNPFMRILQQGVIE